MQNVCIGSDRSLDGNVVSSPEQMGIAEAIAKDTSMLAEEVGRACFDASTNDLHRVAGAMIARAMQSLCSTNMLAQGGLIGDAMSCSRTIVELAIDFAYLAKTPSLVERFLDYAPVHHQRLATHVSQHGGIVDAALMAELTQLRDDFRTDNPDGAMSNWSGRTLADRATEAACVELYRLSYTDQCNASHSGPGTLDYAQVNVDGQHGVHFGRITPESHPIMLAVTGLCVLLGRAISTLGLDPALGDRTLAIAETRVHNLIDLDRERR